MSDDWSIESGNSLMVYILLANYMARRVLNYNPLRLRTCDMSNKFEFFGIYENVELYTILYNVNLFCD